ncbi:DNA polymerase III subunit delta [Blastopirellula marina]|uniref:DNA-directed DNA polymerase n=1 Tax=Blastopirellula marina TaxID=124 RepID=A0A2S8GNY3_9BACT|nr:DNA polymerase III subunit delta [Blastopirellula marina]PQO46135.1 DNA polymerase III subunit delta [Blastopirellula marina]
MANTVHAFDFLAAEETSPPSVCVVFGRDAFLRQLATEQIRRAVLGEEKDIPYGRLAGNTVTWVDVADEVSTVSLFGSSGRRLAVVEDADPFVSRYREELEKFLEKKRPGGVLVLQVEKWAANTRLYKKCNEVGLQVQCNPPEKKSGKKSSLDFDALAKWFSHRAKVEHETKLSAGAARLLVDLLGTELGLIDQEIARLSLFVEPGETIDEDLVQEQVHGGQMQEIWHLVDAAVEGSTADALAQLDRLFQSGERPQKLFGQIAWSLRRFAAATRIYQRARRRGDAVSLRDALKEAGFPNWPKALDEAQKRLLALGQIRGGRLYRQLLELDMSLKGSHSQEARGRLALEKLIVSLSKALDPPRASTTRS